MKWTMVLLFLAASTGNTVRIIQESNDQVVKQVLNVTCPCDTTKDCDKCCTMPTKQLNGNLTPGTMFRVAGKRFQVPAWDQFACRSGACGVGAVWGTEEEWPNQGKWKEALTEYAAGWAKCDGTTLQQAVNGDGAAAAPVQTAEEGAQLEEIDGKCKRWCKTQAGFPIPNMDELKRLANEKCTQDICTGCTGGGATVPDCQDKVMVPEAIKVPDVEVVEAETGVPVCTKGGDFTSQVCSFGQGKICSHIDAPWCVYPSQNPGAQFRLDAKPLCCFDESDSNMDDAETKVAEVVKIMTNDPATTDKDEVQPPVPQCAVDQTFSVDSFKRKDKTVNVCRSSTGRFAKKVCCDPAAFALLESQQRAQEVCETVEDKYCKPTGLTKRNKAKGIPDTHGCKRMYVCVERGEESYGPVPSQSWCNAKTEHDKNRPAEGACIAYRLK